MEIARGMVENKEGCGVLVELKLADMGVDSEMVKDDLGIDDKGEIRAATKEYGIGLLQGYREITTDEDLTEYYDSLGMELWGFVAGYEACLKKQLTLQAA